MHVEKQPNAMSTTEEPHKGMQTENMYTSFNTW